MSAPAPTNAYGAASNLYINWDNVIVTPEEGTSTTAIPVGEVTNVIPDADSQQLIFYGDNRRFARKVVNVEEKRSIKIMGGNPAAIALIPRGVRCTITACLNDAVNKRGVGAINITLYHGIAKKLHMEGSNNKYASGEIEFHAEGNGDDSDPLLIAPVTS